MTLICFLFIFLSVACTESSGGNRYGVSESQLKSDLEALVIKGYCKNERYTVPDEYVIESFEITKRRSNKEKKEDYICCRLTVENDFFRSYVEYSLLYNYYDVGGWIMDDKDIISKKTIPISPVDGACLPDIPITVKERAYNLQEQHIKSIEFDDKNNRSIVKYCYSDDRLSFSAALNIYFENDEWEALSYSMLDRNLDLYDVTVHWNSKLFCSSYSSDLGFVYPDVYGNGIGDIYYVKESEKTISEKYNSVQFPESLLYDISITGISNELNKIYGGINLSAENYESSYGGHTTLKNDGDDFLFESDFDPVNGTFDVNHNINVLAYQYWGYKDKRNFHYVPANITMSFRYDFSGRWKCYRIVINSLLVDDSYIVCGYMTKYDNTH